MSGPPPDIPPGLEGLLPAFAAEVDGDCRALVRLAADGDAPVLAEHAHAMRGKCAMFGETILHDLLTAVELGAGAFSAEEMAALLTRIIERSDQLRKYMSSDISGRP
ncbi:Hpt domain-containing protein [Magnetospirillum sp. UT-4]|uniref:Hpt domain-containing protein n=1 Tax=Magnetospirillum sp. UT-4 TaxID=2681467 RepID=UPI00137FAF12|nr:Hpt domain-containing protein [Magnetospirillum sp. UT-4]CAA7620307.1 hypothetical protein MTBUT4_350024 [Magnetospirillum sp. UT-4]